MTYKAYDILVWVMVSVLGLALVVLGLSIRQLELADLLGWSTVFLGIVMLLGGLVSVGFIATQPTEMPCPHCGKKIVPKVKWSSGHLYLSRKEE